MPIEVPGSAPDTYFKTHEKGKGKYRRHSTSSKTQNVVKLVWSPKLFLQNAKKQHLVDANQFYTKKAT